MPRLVNATNVSVYVPDQSSRTVKSRCIRCDNRAVRIDRCEYHANIEDFRRIALIRGKHDYPIANATT